MVKRKNISEQKHPTPEDLTINTKSTTKEKAELLKDAISLQDGNISSQPKKYGPWKLENKTIKEFSITSPTKGWMKLTVAENNKTKKRYMRLRKFKQNFNINSPEQLANITKAAVDGAKVLGWKKTEESQTLKLLNKIYSLETTKIKDQQRIRDLLSRISDFRIGQLNMDIPKFKQDLKDFEKLLDGNPSEHDLQYFLEKNTWLFGQEYLETQPKYFNQFKLSDSRFDFMLQRYDTFYDIFEIKKADASIISAEELSDETIIPSRENPVSSAVKNAISQMIRYLELVGERKNDLKKEGIYLHKPKGIIIMGRSSNRKQQEAIKTFGYYLNHIEILTYDDLLEKGKTFVRIIEKRRILNG